jgi:hypothetical protein
VSRFLGEPPTDEGRVKSGEECLKLLNILAQSAFLV